MSRLLQNEGQARAHVLAHVVSRASRWTPPDVRPWALNACGVPVLPVGLYVQGAWGQMSRALNAAGFSACQAVDLSRASDDAEFTQAVSVVSRVFQSVVRFSPVSPERALFESLAPDVHWLEGRSQRTTWLRDNTDGSRHVIRSYDAGIHGGVPVSAVTVARLTGSLIHLGHDGVLPEIDRRYEFVRDDLLAVFAPGALEEHFVYEPWDREHCSHSVYRLVMAD